MTKTDEMEVGDIVNYYDKNFDRKTATIVDFIKSVNDKKYAIISKIRSNCSNSEAPPYSLINVEDLDKVVKDEDGQ